MALTKKQKEELNFKMINILNKTCVAFSKLEKEYDVSTSCFSGIHTDEVGWVSSHSYTSK